MRYTEGGYTLNNISCCFRIRTKAVELLQENNIDTICEINIRDLISLLERDITYQFANLRGLAGFTCYDHAGDRYRMFLDSITFNNCPGRTNFTMAHELGHIMLGHLENDHSSSIFISDPRLEIEANLFSDEILMPTSRIIRHRMDAREIAWTVNASITAAQNKIKYLKSNTLYPQEKAFMQTLRIISKYRILASSNTYNDRIVETLHDAWLDPDYEFEGV